MGNANYQHQMQNPPVVKPENKHNNRHKLQAQIAEVMHQELKSARTERSSSKGKFEFLKSKVRFRLTDDEMADLCMCLAGAVVNADHLCTVTGKREPLFTGVKDTSRPVVGK